MTHNFSGFAFDYINPDNSKPSQGYDVPFFDTASEVVVPPVESFELQIDHDLAAFDEEQLQVLFDTAQFAGYRSNEPAFGPGSITASSHSAYDTVSTVSESFYSFPTSPAYAPSNFSFPIEMDFRSLTVGSDYGVTDPSANRYTSGASPDMDLTSFGVLPPSPPTSPPVRYMPKSRSEYTPATSSGRYHVPAISPNVSPQLPTVPPVPSVLSVHDRSEIDSEDPRRRHQCPHCNRAFARAYNLKTHLDTHNPERQKSFICPHRSCGRAFSRKHDLQRHRAAIHHDTASSVSSLSSISPSSRPYPQKNGIGIVSSGRERCQSCGKSWSGRERRCSCNIDIRVK